MDRLSAQAVSFLSQHGERCPTLRFHYGSGNAGGTQCMRPIERSCDTFASGRGTYDGRAVLCSTLLSGLFSISPNAKHQRTLSQTSTASHLAPPPTNNNVPFGACIPHSRHRNECAFDLYFFISHSLYICYIRILLGPQLNAMSANSSVSLASKNACNPSQTPSPSHSQGGSSIGIEGHPQRRVGGSGSFGTGSTSRSTSSTARNTQSLRKQHKGQRRPRLADEDAAAESVSQTPHS